MSVSSFGATSQDSPKKFGFLCDYNIKGPILSLNTVLEKENQDSNVA